MLVSKSFVVTLCFLAHIIFSSCKGSGFRGDYPACSGLLPNSSSTVPFAAVPPNFCPFIWASGLQNPRQIFTVSNGDVLVLESKINQVTVLFRNAQNGPIQKAKLASASGLNHAVYVYKGYLYASAPTTVYRWKYQPGQRSDLGKPETVINSVPCCHHVSRTLAFDDAGLLYVQVGSGSNVDSDSTHSRVVSFDISIIPSGGINWSQGKVFADGMRNEVGLRFDRFGRLWGVENGCDDLYRSDLGGDIHEDNPSEEMNLLIDSKFYGYPFCWSEGKLNRSPSIPGTQWAHPNFMPQISDAFCKDTRNVQPPIYNFPAHNAPMDIIFAYNTGFPADYEGGAFVSSHGSWDKAVPSGYNVRFVYFDYKTNMPTRDIIFFAYNGTSANGPNWPHRPVGLAFVPCSFGTCLLVSSDSSGYIFAIGYNPKSELNE